MLYAIIAAAALAFAVIVICAIGIYRDADLVNRCTGAI